MFITFSSSRKTTAGAFRLGRVYEIADGDDKRKQAVAPHIKSGVAKKLTEKEAAAAREAGLFMSAPKDESEAAAMASADAAAAKVAEDAAAAKVAEDAAAAKVAEDAAAAKVAEDAEAAKVAEDAAAAKVAEDAAAAKVAEDAAAAKGDKAK